MATLFISYSRTDEEFARRLASSLVQLGASVWIDVDEIPAGMKWSRAIQEGLDTCDALILIITPAAMQSENVEDEWQYILDQRKPVFPVLLIPTRIHFQLSRLQYVDFHTQRFETALIQLHSELRRRGIVLAPITADNRDVPVPRQQPLEVMTASELPAARNRRSRGILAGIIALILVMLSIVLIIASSSSIFSLENPAATSETLTEAAGVITPMPSAEVSADAAPTSTVTPTRPPILSATEIHLTDEAAVALRETEIYAGLFTTTQIFALTAASWTDTPTPIYEQTAYRRMTETSIARTSAVAATQTQIAIVSPTPRPSLTAAAIACEGSPPTRLNVGMRAFVTISPEGSERQNLMVRQEPGGAAVGRLSEGTLVYITGAGSCNNGLLWWPVETADGSIRGWSAEGIIGATPNEYFLVPLGS
ncbi:toll/interleukin-1 receptor domain-containing protein [Kamptonema cortianum]|nr:toll/interleukin-1 receptor domain-containing protein [Kamptonema cortianum]